MNTIGWLILFFLISEFGLRSTAAWLNITAVSARIPEPFRDVVDPKQYGQSQAYLRTTTRFGQILSATDLLVLLVFWLAGGFALLESWTRSWSLGPLVTGMIYIAILAGMRMLCHQPFSLYRTFVIEEQFGFNRTTLTTWIKDRFKGLLLTLVLGAPLLAGVLAFFLYAGPAAWLWCWLMITIFMLAIHYIVPTWIMPLFNRFEPLAPGELREAIFDYAASIGFSLDNVFVMDGSKRSTKSNAFFTGFGRHRRIVLFDTLIERHTIEELVAVLAHEMGHYKKKHILTMMLIGIVQSGLLLFLLSLTMTTPALFEAFFVETLSVHAALVFFSLLYTPVDLMLGIVVQAISRRHEYAADRFAAATTRKPQMMISALKKLSVHNLANLSPHPFEIILNYSHPPVLQRIAALRSDDG